MKKIIIPLPRNGFDPTEAAIPFGKLKKSGHKIVFSTPDGSVPSADPIMLTGKGLGLLKNVLMARKDAVTAYQLMQNSQEFQSPIRYDDILINDYRALILAGGHAKGMREYLESEVLQNICAKFMGEKKIVAAVCHGVVLLARSKRPDGKSVLFGKKTTALLKSQEKLAYNLTRLWLGDYYLTYPATTVEDEVMASLKKSRDFIAGATPLLKDSENNLKAGFTVVDGHYISARWPGDIYSFSNEILKLLN